MKIADMKDDMECRCYSYIAPSFLGWSGYEEAGYEKEWISWRGLWAEAKRGVHSYSEYTGDGLCIHEMEVRVLDTWERIENW